ncbi:SAM dependent methyltransferase [Cenarchaeum symbiosum A]|uniref:SAM dependent methyltransferase n=1 Tax=Cenarchaeum symbiosum (strain A) TaxID=414004 RepID=A0RY23_CENSY|nr:SAM dependent methyltransferase [Cenarchaeum symbiosum A]
MRLEEYLGTLPRGIMSGEDVQLPDRAYREILQLAEVGPDDVFYHLGSGDGRAVNMAAAEFGARAVGIEMDNGKCSAAGEHGGPRTEFRNQDVRDADISDATVILFWFADEEVISSMMPKFGLLQDGCKVATLWGPLPGYMPYKVRFPFVINRAPFEAAPGLGEQLLAVFGVKCIDFVTAWEHSERYTKAIELADAENNRFVTILQTVVTWINASNLGVACGEGVPDSISTYMGILRNFYGIETKHLLD